MDLLSHALMGGLVASLGLQKQYGMAASATMVAANLLPDIDSAAMVLGPKYFFLYHRHPLTHSVGGAVVLSAALTAVITLATPLKRPGLVFVILFSGIMLHLLGDLLTPWPIPFLWPFSPRTYSFDLINFLDPLLLVLLGISFLSIRRWPEGGTLVAVLTLSIVAGYLGFRLYGQRLAASVVREKLAGGEIAVLPHGLSLANWDVIVHDDLDYAYYVVDALRGEVQESQIFHSVSDERTAIIANKSELVRAFLKRARFPVTRISEHESLVTAEWLDVHLLNSGGAVRGVRVTFDARGEIVEERFVFGASR